MPGHCESFNASTFITSVQLWLAILIDLSLKLLLLLGLVKAFNARLLDVQRVMITDRQTEGQTDKKTDSRMDTCLS